jgi:hypothetical protein
MSWKSKNPLYITWYHMMARCYRVGSDAYHRYGGRGIRVCERWHVFENFKGDIPPKPEGDYSLDRINNSGNYEPGNMRWATPAEQNSNRRTSRIYVFNNKEMCVAHIAQEVGVSKNTIMCRLRRGFPIEQAISKQRCTGRFEDQKLGEE